MTNLENFRYHQGKVIKTIGYSGPLYEYLIDKSKIRSDYLDSLVKLASQTEKNYMQIGEDQAHFLQFLISVSNIKKVLEIGCYLGYSAIVMASSLPKDGKLVTIERKAQWRDIAIENIKNSPFQDKIDLIFDEALDALRNLLEKGEKFDLIFIDADKVNTINYYEYAKKILNPGGIVLIDNVLWRGYINDETDQSERAIILRNLNEKIKNDNEMESFILSVGDGIHIARKI